ncbi:hypothetical protein BC941DRAFT_132051 [Chlamydoabsidia padenii]|nr:hypothetical protein BC941DRAFT_132051 [Chlamydoabsidia padenii]
MEHTTLCSNDRYPVRDSLFKILRKRLATFMNVFTSSDFTISSFATTNKVDYNKAGGWNTGCRRIPLLQYIHTYKPPFKSYKHTIK